MPKKTKPEQLREAPQRVLDAYNRLNPKQKAFALALPKAKSQVEAMHLAGYAKSTAEKLAFKTAGHKDVQAVVGYLTETVAEQQLGQSKDSLERQIEELVRVGLADPRTLFDDLGRMLPIREWPDDIARSVSSIESFEEYQGKGDEREAIGTVRKVKFHMKLDAIDKIAKIRGYYRPQQHEIKHQGLSTILEEINGADTGPGPSR